VLEAGKTLRKRRGLLAWREVEEEPGTRIEAGGLKAESVKEMLYAVTIGTERAKSFVVVKVKELVVVAARDLNRSYDHKGTQAKRSNAHGNHLYNGHSSHNTHASHPRRASTQRSNGHGV